MIDMDLTYMVALVGARQLFLWHEAFGPTSYEEIYEGKPRFPCFARTY